MKYFLLIVGITIALGSAETIGNLIGVLMCVSAIFFIEQEAKGNG